MQLQTDQGPSQNAGKQPPTRLLNPGRLISTGQPRRVVTPKNARQGVENLRKDPFYRTLLETEAPPGIFFEDRQMFAGLLTMARQEGRTFAAALGLSVSNVDKLFAIYFPKFDPYRVRETAVSDDSPALEANPQILAYLLAHVSRDRSGRCAHLSDLLARIIAARARIAGNLWAAMGFNENAQLTAAIRRHLPTLAIANGEEIPWKRFLFIRAHDDSGAGLNRLMELESCQDYRTCLSRPKQDQEARWQK